MMLVIMFVCIMLGATLVVSEKLSPARFRLFTTPSSDLLFISSHFITTIIVAVIQIGIIFAAAHYVFNLSLGVNITATILIAILGAIIFASIGMIIGYLFADEQTTILGAICTGTAFLLVSDLLLPLEAVPQSMREILIYTPFVILTNLLRRALLFGANLFDMTPNIYFAAIYAVLLFVIIILAHKLLKIKYFFAMSKGKGRK
jgi:ABC-2 type transport system permease protein